MKVFTLATALLCLNLPLSAQWSGNFSELELIPCYGDSGTMISQPVNWTIYQTLENTWNGTIDSSICINVDIVSTKLMLAMDQIDTSRSVFIRYKFYESNKVLLNPNAIYLLQIWSGTTGMSLNSTADCPGELCSGAITGIQFMNEDSTGFNMRYHSNVALNGDYTGCVTTEPFEENWLREFIYKITPNQISAPLNEAIFSLGGLYLQEDYDQNQIQTCLIPEWLFNGTSYEVPLYQISTYSGWGTNYLALNGAWPDQYPSSANQYFIDAELIQNIDTPATININIDYYESLSYQLFTQFRGGLVDGSDSIRHIVNLVQDGGNICMESWIDVLFQKNRKFIYKGGQLDLNGRTACMQFRKGGALEVASGSTLYYGQDGFGILLLRTGGTIILSEGSHLRINNTLKLKSFEPNLSNLASNQITMDLPPDSKLSFGEHAKVMAQPGEEDFMRLNINMLGGEIDLSNLDATSRSYINLIYPTPGQDASANLKISPNPSTGELNIQWIGSFDETITLQLFDIQGRLYWEEKRPCTKGLNIIDLILPELANGLYIVKLDSPGQGMSTHKLAISK
ncbi:MAG: T9SS type A sorting domain-containing protein [Saprospiraceae bacterium]|nr:T9SS type A sorting domain-containing protein [Saprospiraceae bacterium]